MVALVTLLVVLVTPAPVIALAPPPGYEAAVGAVPARHWALVRQIDLSYRGRVNYRDARIVLPHQVKDSTLWHEVGHLVLAPRSQLGEAWCAAFWPNGRRPVGTLNSRYGGTSCYEDAAVSYEELIEHGCLIDRPRERWLRANVFRSGEIRACSP